MIYSNYLIFGWFGILFSSKINEKIGVITSFGSKKAEREKIHYVKITL